MTGDKHNKVYTLTCPCCREGKKGKMKKYWRKKSLRESLKVCLKEWP